MYMHTCVCVCQHIVHKLHSVIIALINVSAVNVIKYFKYFHGKKTGSWINKEKLLYYENKI